MISAVAAFHAAVQYSTGSVIATSIYNTHCLLQLSLSRGIYQGIGMGELWHRPSSDNYSWAMIDYGDI